MAQDSETRNISDLEAEEIALAEAHARLPVVPDSPEAQVNPPGLDNTQLLIEFQKMAEKMEMMQAELNKVKMENSKAKMENSKLKSIYTDDQQEQPPE